MSFPSSFSAAERHALLSEYAVALDKLRIVSAALEEAPADAQSDLAAIYMSLRQPLLELLERYRQGVPRPALSRCPFTGVVAHHSIDTLGLDGFWWDYEQPVRPTELLPATWLAWRGAAQIDRQLLDKPPFLCCPGPEAPYVLPEILSHDGVKVVISLLHVGRHVVFAICYFASFGAAGQPRINGWGASGPREPSPDEMDFDLEKWLRSGKLLWIAPGDATLVLRAELSRCPFLDLPGERAPLRIDRGRLRSSVSHFAPAHTS